MKVRIGVIGPADSMDQMMLVTKEFNHVQFIPFIYDNIYQIDEFILKNKEPIDQWLFSGVLNYYYVIKKGLIDEEHATYPPLYESSFFGTLLEAQFAENTVFRKVSIDTFSNEKIEKILPFSNLQGIEYTNFPFKDYTYIHQVTDFHERLYKQGKSAVAITSTTYAYEQLKKKNIPVYRMKPSYLSIKLSLNLLIERSHSNRFKKSQIAVIGCYVDFNEEKNREHIYSSYKMQMENLDIKKELLQLAEKVSGFFISGDNGYYLIYTNRGEIDRELEMYVIELGHKINNLHQLKPIFSIGYGKNASEAEQHVHLGLKQKREDFSIIIVDENQEMTVKEEKFMNDDIQYSPISVGEEWEDKIKNTGISVSVVSKMLAFSIRYNKTEFCSQDISNWFKSSSRNARRILLELEKGGLIKQCGEIQTGNRGRPSKLYCFIDNKAD